MEFIELINEIIKYIPPGYEDAGKSLSAFLPVLFIFISFATCFFGHQLHKIWNAVLFFVFGFFITALTGIYFFNEWDISIFIWLGLAAGILASSQAHRLHVLQLFIINAYMSFSVLPDLLSYVMDREYALLIGFVLAVLIGFLAARWKYIVTILSTAVNGAMSGVSMLFALFHVNNHILDTAAAMFFMTAGALVQFYMEKRKADITRRKAVKITAEEHLISE